MSTVTCVYCDCCVLSDSWQQLFTINSFVNLVLGLSYCPRRNVRNHRHTQPLLSSMLLFVLQDVPLFMHLVCHGHFPHFLGHNYVWVINAKTQAWKKASVQMHGKSLPLAVKMKVTRHTKAENQFNVCKAVEKQDQQYNLFWKMIKKSRNVHKKQILYALHN